MAGLGFTALSCSKLCRLWPQRSSLSPGPLGFWPFLKHLPVRGPRTENTMTLSPCEVLLLFYFWSYRMSCEITGFYQRLNWHPGEESKES